MARGLERIVVGYNGGDACRLAVARASALARRTGAILDLVSVAIPIVPVGGFGWVAPYDETHYVTRLLEQRVREGAGIAGADLEVVPHAVLGTPAPEIVKVARETGAGLIVLGAVRHTALERFFLGSTVDRVLRLSSVPCLVVGSRECARRLLVAADDSAFGEHALHAALLLASATGAEVRCVHVVTAPPVEAVAGRGFDLDDHLRQLTDRFEAFVEGARERFARSVSQPPADVTSTLRVGTVVDEVLAEREAWQADLVVVGSHGRGFVARAVLGSVSEALLRASPVSVLVAPGPAPGPEEAAS